MNLTCQKVTELLYDFVTGDMTRDDCDTLKAHLRDCPPCEVFLESYRETIRLTKALPCDELPEELVKRLENYLNEQLGKD